MPRRRTAARAAACRGARGRARGPRAAAPPGARRQHLRQRARRARRRDAIVLAADQQRRHSEHARESAQVPSASCSRPAASAAGAAPPWRSSAARSCRSVAVAALLPRTCSSRKSASVRAGSACSPTAKALQHPRLEPVRPVRRRRRISACWPRAPGARTRAGAAAARRSASWPPSDQPTSAQRSGSSPEQLSRRCRRA